MKSSGKKWMTAATALVLIGCVCLVALLAMNHWNISALSNDRYVMSTEEIGDGFTGLSLDAGTADVSFVPSENGSCSVVFNVPEKVERMAEVQGDTLVISVRDTRKWYEHIVLFPADSPSVTVYLPQTQYAALEVKGSTGNIVLPAGFTFESVAVDASTGNVTCYSEVSETVSINLSTGNICLENMSAGECVLSASTGRVELRNVACAGSVAVAVSTGKTVMQNVTCACVSSDGSTGNIVFENVIVSGLMSLERSTGNINLTGCDADELLLKTSTGNVKASLLSDKVFIAKSSTGRVSVPATVTGGKCEITTSTGDITVEIA